MNINANRHNKSVMRIPTIIVIIKAGRGGRVTTHLQLAPRLEASVAKQ